MIMSDADLGRGGDGGGMGGAFWRFLDNITKAGVIIGGVFAAWQYWEAKKDQRVERTMEYIVRYEGGQVGDARRRIDAVLRQYIDQFEAVRLGGISEADRTEMVMTIVEGSNGQIADDIDIIVDFFEGLRTCTQTELCDAAVADEYFTSSDISTTLSNFEPYLEARRRNFDRYGAGLEHFASPR